MPLTFGDARKFIAQYAERGGKAASSEAVRLFVHEVMQYMLFTGAYGSYRTFSFIAVHGEITLPAELETPLKIKIGAEVGNVWDKWFDFNSRYDLNSDEACLPGSVLREMPNDYSTVYDIPSVGAAVGVQCQCAEAPDAELIVFGKDLHGQEVYSFHNGERTLGERLSIKAGNLQITQNVFRTITSIKKSRTNGYVELYWVNRGATAKGFLSNYSPDETIPLYKRARLQTSCGAYTRIEVLARIRLKPFYSDAERIPFDNIVLLKTAAQSRNAANNNDNQTAQFKDGFAQDLTTRENVYKNPNTGIPLAVGGPTAHPIRSIRSAGRGYLRRVF